MSDAKNELNKFETDPKYRSKVIGRIHKDQDNEYQKRIARLQKEKAGLVNGRTREIQRITESRWQTIANSSIKVNHTEGIVRINNSDVKFSSIKGAEMNVQMGARIVTHETTQAKSKKHASLGGAVVGGMVFGPAGALIGGTTMGKTTTKGKSTSYSDQIPTCVHMGVMVNVDGFASEIVLISSQVDQSSMAFTQAQNKAQAIISQLAQLANTPVPEHFLQPCEENSVKLIDQQIDAKEVEIRNATADKPTYALPDMYRDPNYADMSDTQYLDRLKEEDVKREAETARRQSEELAAKQRAKQEKKLAKQEAKQQRQKNREAMIAEGQEHLHEKIEAFPADSAAETMKKIGIIILKIVFWAISIFNLLAMIAAFATGGVLSGILFLVLTVLVNPLGKKLIDTKVFKLPLWVYIIACVIIFFAGVMTYPATESASDTTQAQRIETEFHVAAISNI